MELWKKQKKIGIAFVIFLTFSNVKSSAIIPLKPSVPNFIFPVAIFASVVLKLIYE